MGALIRPASSLVVLALLVAACGPTGVTSSSASPTVATSPSAEASTEASARPSEPVEASPSVAPAVPPDFADAPLGPGEYVVDINGVSTSFTIPGAGFSGGSFLPNGIYVFADGVQGALSFTFFDGKVYTDPCVGDANTTIERSAAAFIGAIAANKGLSADAPVTTTFAGASGMQIDVTADADPGCGEERIWLWVLPPDGDFHLNRGEAARFIAADVGGWTWVAVIETFPGADQAALITSTQPLVDSFAIH